MSTETKLPEPERPECAKLVSVSPDSQKIGEFIDWLNENGIRLCRWTELEDAPDQYMEIHDPMEKLLARYFEIDLDKVETERRALLDWLHEQQKG